jgi:hypothetical protein
MAVDNLTWAEYFRMLKAALHNDETYFSFGEIVAARQPTQHFSMSTPSQAQSLTLEDAVDTNQARLKLWHAYHGRELFTIFEFNEEDEDDSALGSSMEFLIDQYREYQTKKTSMPSSPTSPNAADVFRGATTNKRMAEANKKTLNFKRPGDLVNPHSKRYQPKRTRIGVADDVSKAPQNPNRSLQSILPDDDSDEKH